MTGRSAIARRRPPVESAAAAGIVYSVLAVTSIVIVQSVPAIESSDAWEQWISQASNRRWLLIALSLASVAAIAFLWFVAVVRRRLGDREDRFFATVFFGSAILHLALWLVATALVSALAIDPGDVSTHPAPEVARYALNASTALLLVAGPRVQAVFVASTSTLFWRTGVVPVWLAYLGYVLAAAMFAVPIVATPLGFGLPVFVFVSSLVILLVQSQSATDGGAPKDVPGLVPDDRSD